MYLNIFIKQFFAQKYNVKHDNNLNFNTNLKTVCFKLRNNQRRIYVKNIETKENKS